MILRLVCGALAENRAGGVNLEARNMLQAPRCRRTLVMKFVRTHANRCLTHFFPIGPSVYALLTRTSYGFIC